MSEFDERAVSEPVEDAASTPTWQRFDVSVDTEAALVAAQAAISAGECIVLPTDTVYGIGATAFSPEAVSRLLAAKHRGRDMPPPVLIAEPAMLGALATSLGTWATALAEAQWPGALTLIVTAHPSLPMDLGDTGGTIAVRVPDHDFTRELLRRTGPLAVSSANTSGNPASTSIEAAIEQLGGSVSIYLDAGPTRDDAPSTIVDFSRSSVGQVVREGAISLETLREVAPHVVGIPILADEADADDPDADETNADDAPDPSTGSPEGESDGSDTGPSVPSSPDTE